MRKVFRIKEAKNEVRKKIDDLLAIVESGYREVVPFLYHPPLLLFLLIFPFFFSRNNARAGWWR